MDNELRSTGTPAGAQPGSGIETVAPTSEISKLLKNDGNNATDEEDYEGQQDQLQPWRDFWRDGRDNDPAWNTYNPKNWKIVPEKVLACGGKPMAGEPLWCEHIKSHPSATVFNIFSRLPIELRRKIWEHALPNPRVVKVEVITTTDWVDFRCILVHGRQFPAEPHLACTESWKVFNEHYHRPTCQGSNRILPDGTIQSPVPIGYIDARRDTVLIEVRSIQDLNDHGVSLDISKVEHLAVAGHDQLQQPQSFWLYSNAICPRLRTLTVVLGTVDPDEYRWDYEGNRLHLVEVDTNLRLLEIVSEQSSDPLHTRRARDSAFARENDIVPFITTAISLNRQFDHQLHRDNKTWKDIKFTVAMLSTEDLEDTWIEEPVWLAPVVPQPYKVSYCTGKKTNRSKISYLWIKELGLCAKCERRGILSCPYDGIKELFGEN